MLCTLARRLPARSPLGTRALAGETFGFVGLGKIGGAMANNLLQAGATVVAYDRSDAAVASAVAAGASAGASPKDVAERARVVFTAVPDDRALDAVVGQLLPGMGEGSVHASCSTVAPETSRRLAEVHTAKGIGFVAAPVFARPDGMRRREATIPVSGAAWAKAKALPALGKTSTGVHDFGEDPGAANAVKLGGNFLIAAAIEALAEAAALAESNGVDREQFVGLMNSTIFDCLIYKGYGHRVAARDHFPYPDAHFSLDLGSKDVRLVCEAASQARCPMPVASLLRDRFVGAQNKGWGELDWSALALRASEDAGADVGQITANLLAGAAKQREESK